MMTCERVMVYDMEEMLGFLCCHFWPFPFLLFSPKISPIASRPTGWTFPPAIPRNVMRDTSVLRCIDDEERILFCTAGFTVQMGLLVQGGLHAALV
jgi:hypothetical protein